MIDILTTLSNFITMRPGISKLKNEEGEEYIIYRIPLHTSTFTYESDNEH